MLSYFLRCAVPQDESKLFCHIIFLQKCISYSEELQQALLTMSYICCKPNNDLWLYGSWFLFSSPELENFAFYKPSQPQLKKTVISKLYELRNVVLSIIFWIQPTWAANYCRQHWYRATAYISSYFSHVSICHVWSAWHNYVVVGSLR